MSAKNRSAAAGDVNTATQRDTDNASRRTICSRSMPVLGQIGAKHGQDLRPGGAAISHPKRNCRDPEIRPSGTDAAESGQPEFHFGQSRHGADQPPGWRTLPVWVVLK